MLLVLDSSVIVAAFREEEDKYNKCKKLLEDTINGKHVVILPTICLVEIVSAIRRRTDSKPLAIKIRDYLLSIDNLYFIEITKSVAEKASDISIETGLKGMDAIIVQIARENKASLITLDKEMENLSKNIVKIISIDKL